VKVCHGKKIGPPPHVNLAHEIKVQNAVRDLIHRGLVKSAHDCSEGGLAVALAECCFNPEELLGADVHCGRYSVGRAASPQLKHQGRASQSEAATALFNESQSRIVISVSLKDAEKTMSILHEHSVPYHRFGKVGGDDLCIRVDDETFRWPITDLYDDWFNAIRSAVEEETETIPSL
jgi:phosphoribosylformylglycinamidine synthase subunit PurL